jgi:hypothetical protein
MDSDHNLLLFLFHFQDLDRNFSVMKPVVVLNEYVSLHDFVRYIHNFCVA